MIETVKKTILGGTQVYGRQSMKRLFRIGCAALCGMCLALPATRAQSNATTVLEDSDRRQG